MRRNKTLLLSSIIVCIGLASGARAQMARSGAFLDNADANHDGQITRDEFITARAATFDKLDRNHDGVWTADDYAIVKRFRPQAAEKLDALLADSDADHDGRVTREEFNAAPTRLFDRIDTNHDGVIDRAELAAFRSSGEQ
jgi:Ca2+-binding EF-hand superfamily protein